MASAGIQRDASEKQMTDPTSTYSQKKRLVEKILKSAEKSDFAAAMGAFNLFQIYTTVVELYKEAVPGSGGKKFFFSGNITSPEKLNTDAVVAAANNRSLWYRTHVITSSPAGQEVVLVAKDEKGVPREVWDETGKMKDVSGMVFEDQSRNPWVIGLDGQPPQASAEDLAAIAATGSGAASVALARQQHDSRITWDAGAGTASRAGRRGPAIDLGTPDSGLASGGAVVTAQKAMDEEQVLRADKAAEDLSLIGRVLGVGLRSIQFDQWKTFAKAG